MSDDLEGLATYVSGDDGDNILEPSESWVYELTGTASSGQYDNIGSVSASPPVGSDVTDSDASSYFGSSPGVTIDKVTDDGVQVAGDGLFIETGAGITWTYTVTNTGNVNLDTVVVSDDLEGLATYVSGDDGDNILEPSESWVYELTGTASSGQYDNIGSVSASPPVGSDVTDSDASSYFGSSPGVTIDKVTDDGVQVAGDGLFIETGAGITWTYTVTNTGNVDLDTVVVSDDLEGLATYVSGDDGDNILEPSESWVYELTGTASSGQYDNIGSVSASPPVGSDVTDSDASSYFGSSPGVTIDKVTDDGVQVAGDGLFIETGAGITWTYTVTNTGNVDLDTVVVSDDLEGLATYVSGDDGDNILEPSESWVYELTGTASSGHTITLDQ